jgi:hypothetical protein
VQKKALFLLEEGFSQLLMTHKSLFPLAIFCHCNINLRMTCLCSFKLAMGSRIFQIFINFLTRFARIFFSSYNALFHVKQILEHIQITSKIRTVQFLAARRLQPGSLSAAFSQSQDMASGCSGALVWSDGVCLVTCDHPHH